MLDKMVRESAQDADETSFMRCKRQATCAWGAEGARGCASNQTEDERA